MAHTKAGGTTKNGRDSNPKMRGVKAYGGEMVGPGDIIVRQKGTVVHCGRGVRLGRDFTIYAVTNGQVKFENFDKKRKKVSVYPAAAAA